MYKKVLLGIACFTVFSTVIFFATPVESLFKVTEFSAVEVTTPVLSAEERTPTVRTDFITRITAVGARTIQFSVPVRRESAEQAIDAIRILNILSPKDPIFLILNSPGGDVNQGVRIMAAIQGSKAPVTAVVEGQCSSMCAYIFESAKHRYMVHRSTLMFHQAYGGIEGEYGKLKSRITYWTDEMDKLNAEVADRAKMSRRKFLAKIQNEYYLSSDSAVSLHFSDGTVFLDFKK